MLSFGASSLLGLDVGSTMIKAVELENKDGRVLVRRAGVAAMPARPLSAGALFPSAAAAEAIRKLCREQKLRGKRVALALGGEDVLVTRVKVERADEAVVAARLREEANRQSRFPLDGASVDFQVLQQPADSEWIDALVVAADAEQVKRAAQLLQDVGKTLVIADSAPCALMNAYEFNYRPGESELVALLHIGAAFMTVCVLRGPTPLVVRDLPLAPDRISEEEWSLPNRITVQVERVFELMDEIADEHPVEPRSSEIRRLLISGGGCRLKGLEEALRDRIGLPFEELNPFLRVEFEASDSVGRLVSDNAHYMPIAVGLALRGLEAAV